MWDQAQQGTPLGGRKEGKGWLWKTVSGANCNWKPMRKACVKAATAVNGSISSDRDARGMIQKVPGPGVTRRGVSVMQDLFSILFMSL